MTSLLKYQLCTITPRYLEPEAGFDAIDVDYDLFQFKFSIYPAIFNYDECKVDGSDIVFYQKVEGVWKLIRFFEREWNYGGTSLYILELQKVKHDEQIEVILEYGKLYEPPTGTSRQSLRTTNIEDIVPLYDDFDTQDSSKWNFGEGYSVSGSKLLMAQSCATNMLRQANFYTKESYDPWLYEIDYKGKIAPGKFVWSKPTDSFDYHFGAGYGIYLGLETENGKITQGTFEGFRAWIQVNHYSNQRGEWESCGSRPGLLDTHYDTTDRGVPSILDPLSHHFIYVYQLGSINYYYDSGDCGFAPPTTFESWVDKEYVSTLKKSDAGELYYTFNSGNGSGGTTDTNLKMRKTGAFGFCGLNGSDSYLEWAMVLTNQIFIAGYEMSYLVPTLEITEPESSLCSLLPRITVEARDWFDAQDIALEVNVTTDYYEQCIAFLNQEMSATNANDADWSYKLIESDDFLARGNFIVNATATNQFGVTLTDTKAFTINNCVSTFNYASLTRDFENQEATMTYVLENETEERVNIRHYLQNINQNNKLIPIEVIDADVPYHDNYLLGLKTTPVSLLTHTFDFKMNQDELYDTLNKKDIYVDSQVIVYDINDVEYDLSQFVQTYSIDRKADLGATEASIDLVLAEELSPFYSEGALQTFFGNKVIINQKMKDIAGVTQLYRKFTGYMSSVAPSKLAIHIVAHDKFRRFTRKTVEDYHFSPTKVSVTENLRTFDGIRFRSSQSAWVQFPTPAVYVGGRRLVPGEYVVDYPRGEVFIFINTLGNNGIVQTNKIAAENSVGDDRATFALTFTMNKSSQPEIVHNWIEKIEYTCVGGVGTDFINVDKYESLSAEDFVIDYEKNTIILLDPIAEDTVTVFSHNITITCREVYDIYATYSYQLEGTNEVEDIIESLATEVGFTAAELQDTASETLYKGSGNVFYTNKNRLISVQNITVREDIGILPADYTTDLDSGKITMLTNFNRAEYILDPIFSTQHVLKSTSEIVVERDEEDFFACEASIKVSNWTQGDYVDLDYDRHYFYKSAGKYDTLGIYIKTNKITKYRITLMYKSGGSEYLDVTPADINTWTLVEFLGTGTARNDLYKIRVAYYDALSSVDAELHLNYLHIEETPLTINYTYKTLQKTDITINEQWFLTESIDTYMEIIEELMKQVEPSYLIHVDEYGKLKGEYTKISTYVMRGDVLKQMFVDKSDYAGYFYLPDMFLKMLKTAETALSDEEIYTGVQVLGKLSDRNNVAGFSTVTDTCTWAPGYAYAQNTALKTVQYISPSIPAVLIKTISEQAPSNYVGTASVDGDVWSGIQWHVMQTDNSNRPMGTEAPQLLVTLPEAVLWDEICICVGSYKNKIIREELLIKVEDETGQVWYPSGETANKQNGNTGSWLKFKNDFNQNIKIKKIHVLSSECFAWVDTHKETTSKK
jgi:hypothetical protein